MSKRTDTVTKFGVMALLLTVTSIPGAFGQFMGFAQPLTINVPTSNQSKLVDLAVGFFQEGLVFDPHLDLAILDRDTQGVYVLFGNGTLSLDTSSGQFYSLGANTNLISIDAGKVQDVAWPPPIFAEGLMLTSL